MTKIKNKKRITFIFCILFLIGIIYSSYKIIVWKLNVSENNKIKENMQDKINIIDPSVNEEEQNQKIKYNIDFKALKEINPDTVAYVKINNTNIDYVVVKGNDNKYYLKHNFEKKWNIAGWIFSDYHNKFDESDKNIVIYGHNTQDGTMFGTLKKILNKEWYENKDNYEIVLVTENKTYYYEVFSTYSIVAEDYYINTEFKTIEEFDKFINKIRNRSIYDYNVEVSNNDKILTLSSCIGDGKKRVVLHAKLK